MKNRKAFKLRPLSILIGIAVCLWALIAVIPFLYMVLSSFKTSQEMFLKSVFSLPDQFQLKNYAEVLEGHFLGYLRNSAIVLVISLCGIIAIASMASYVFSRLMNGVIRKVFAIVVACMSIPIHIAFIPVFILTQGMHTYDTVWGLIGPYIAFYLPISVFMLTGFMEGIPKEIEEAAVIDGCSYFQIFTKIIFPLSKPGLVTIAIYDSVYIWNEFSFALILTNTMASKTLPLSISDFKGEYTMNVPLVMTVLTMCAIPMIVAFCIGQDKLVKGMVSGAVKG